MDSSLATSTKRRSGGERLATLGEPIDAIHSGDVVSVAPNQKHWHGAAKTTAMTHVAIQESLDRKAVEWLEKVTDDRYEGKT